MDSRTRRLPRLPPSFAVTYRRPTEANQLLDRSKTQSSFFVLVHNGRCVLIAKPASYQEALDAIHAEFPETQAKQVTLQTKELDVCEGKLTDIPERSWDIIINHISSVTVTVEEQTATAPLHPTPTPLKSLINPTTGNRVGNSHFLVRNPQVQSPYTSGWQFIPGDRVSQARDTTADKNPDMTLRYNKSDPTLDTTVESLTIGDGDSFRGSVPPESQRGGKPVIYLFSPETLDVTVSLALVPEWEFSAVYPVAPIKSTPLGQRITWDVRTKSNGDLTECASGLDVSYLFWEAETDPSRPMSPPPSSTLTTQPSNIASFRPTSSDLSDGDSVLLPTATMTLYLDEALTALGLHTEARTSFITYWLPSLLKHPNVALCFVPQSAYEQAARLDVLPAPDVVTRIFMLFKGVPDDETVDWPTAKAKAASGVDWWQDVVGVNIGRALDPSLYRLLEWGGMEVIRK